MSVTAPPDSSFVDLPEDWRQSLSGEDQALATTLQQWVAAQRACDKSIFPPQDELFAACEATPLASVKVVILGQDPYHGAGQAHGLSFSVRPSVKIPPSLRNIYKELHSDLNIPPAAHGYLQHWAEQGVLLLNAVLSVEEAQAGSHQGQGWETLTDHLLDSVNQHGEGVVFMLWGAGARDKAKRLDETKHLVLQAPHPSPLSAYRGFFGCGHFSAANAFLQKQGRSAIDWQLPTLDAEPACGQTQLPGF